MYDKKRILIVEDDLELIDFYLDGLSSLNVDIDTSVSKNEALEKIRNRSYHLAIVDIMLTSNIEDRSGLEVVDYINFMQDNTKIIVASSTIDVHVPADLFQKNIGYYLIKNNIRKAKDYLDPVTTSLNEVKLNLLGNCPSVLSYLSKGRNVDDWISLIRNELSISRDSISLIFEEIFNPLLPVLKLKKSKECISVDTNNGSFYGTIWSRSLGKPLWISISKNDNYNHSSLTNYNYRKLLTNKTFSAIRSYIKEHLKRNIFLQIWCLDNVNRDLFDEVMDC